MAGVGLRAEGGISVNVEHYPDPKFKLVKLVAQDRFNYTSLFLYVDEADKLIKLLQQAVEEVRSVGE